MVEVLGRTERRKGLKGRIDRDFALDSHFCWCFLLSRHSYAHRLRADQRMSHTWTAKKRAVSGTYCGLESREPGASPSRIAGSEVERAAVLDVDQQIYSACFKSRTRFP